MHSTRLNHRGFTLIELLIAMAVFAIVLPLIYQAFVSQQKAYTNQQMAVEMQQNARSAIALMKREIRMAGFAPAATDGQNNDFEMATDTDGDTDSADDDNDYPGGRPGLKDASTNSIRFTRDSLPDPDFCADGNDNDGDGNSDEFDECFSDGATSGIGEDITYSLSGTTLMRDDANDGSPPQTLAYDIEAVAFGYSADMLPLPGGDNAVDVDPADPDKFLYWPTVPGPRLDTIAAVKIWLLARTAYPVKGYSDPTPSYQVGNTTFVPVDRSYQRTLLVATVYCRN